jgi:hypothetical protein
MVTSRQVRAARALLGWDTGAARGQGPGRADRVEAAQVRSALVRDATREAVRKALEGAGIVFLSSGRGEGVMLVRRETRQPDEEA